MPTLYDLSQEYRQIAEAIDNEDEAPDGAAELLAAIEGDIDHKVENCVKLLDQWEADEAELKAHAERIRSRIGVMRNRQRRLREWVLLNMQLTGINKIESPWFTMNLVQGRERVVVDDADDVPDAHCRIQRTPNLAAISDAIRTKGPVSYAHIERGPETLRIKRT